MHADMPRRRVLVAAGASAVFSLRNLFAHETLSDRWEPVEAENLTKARFVMQHHPCEIALLSEEVFMHEGDYALAWLTHGREVPVVVLTSDTATTVAAAYRHGADLCLSRDMAVACPAVLSAALDRAACLAEKYRGTRRTQTQLTHCRRHMDRLVNLIWRASPAGEGEWGTQRYTLERLQEEMARVQRHGGPLTIAVGEVQPATAPAIAEWTSAVITRTKRRCDVAGQYGLDGFLLMMVLTPEAGGVTCCRRLQRLIKNAATEGGRGPVRPAFGVASCATDVATPQALLRRAEQNLEHAKAGAGKGIVAECEQTV